MTIEYPVVTQAADGTVTRALPARTPTSHAHVVADITDFPTLFDGAYSSLSEIPSEFNPSSHPHGNITNDGTIGTTADLILGTGTAGAIETRTASQVRTLLGLATTDDVTFNGLTITETNANVTPFSLSGYSLTGSNAQSMVSLAGIWNTTGTPTLINSNVNWTAAAVDSSLLRLQVDNTTRFDLRFPFGKAGPLCMYMNSGSAGTFFFFENNQWGFRTNGQDRLVVRQTGLTLMNNQVLFEADGSNIWHQRNGTNGQIARWAKTWTTSTNNEVFELDCAGNATTFDFAVCSGSAGGSNRGLRFGSKYAGGAFSSWLSFDSAGVPTFHTNGTINASSAAINTFRLEASQIRVTTGVTWNTTTSGTVTTGLLGFAATNAVSGADIAFRRISSDVIEANNGTAGTVRDLSFRDITLVPSSSRTLSTNGQFTIEMTSNTAGNLVYRGSDGVTRRMALTFS